VLKDFTSLALQLMIVELAPDFRREVRIQIEGVETSGRQPRQRRVPHCLQRQLPGTSSFKKVFHPIGGVFISFFTLQLQIAIL
jgi:hypothetical protein